MTINVIIKKALERLKEEGKLLTPDFYAEAFCKEAKRAGMIVDDCTQVDKYAKTLNSSYQKELAQYHLTTTPELIRYLISTLNRINPSNCISTLEATNMLFGRVLDTIEILHNQQASKLAMQTKELLGRPNISVQQFEHFRQLWINFLTTYDDVFLNKLKPLGKVTRSDLKTTIQGLEIIKQEPRCDFEGIVALLTASMVPSIASSVNDTIASLTQTLHDNPEMITSKGMEQDILSAIKLRISLDKDSLKQMILSLDDILDKLSLQLIDIIEKSDQSNLDIKAAKKELDEYNHHGDIDFKTAHHKLYTIALALEESALSLNDNAKAQNNQTNMLSAKIETLEQELRDAKEASREDFLTKLYNKRAIDEFLKMKEYEYERYDRDYSIIMFDIDHFKEVNDTYGHEAGDTILSAFANILRDLSRKVDVVGRVGGEEFIAILSQTDMKGAIKLAQKVCHRTEETKFIYKEKKIDVTVSAGVSQRAKLTSLQTVLNSADEHLYSAKKNGRNRVEPTK